MYADFKAILKPIQATNPYPESSHAKVINQHIPSGFCVNSKFVYGKVENRLKLYRGEDCVEVFCIFAITSLKKPEDIRFPKSR